MPDTTDTSTVVDLDMRRRAAEIKTTDDTAAALEQLVFSLEASLRELYRGSTALPGLADKIEDLFRDGNDQFVEEDGEFLRAALAKSTHRMAEFEMHLSDLQDVIR